MSIRALMIPALISLLATSGAYSAPQDTKSKPHKRTVADLKHGELANKIIDRHMRDGWKKFRVSAAPRAGTAEFMRRVYLDLVGVIPSVSEVRAYLGSQRPNKRAKLIDDLMESPRYGEHWADIWGRALINADARQGQTGQYIGAFQKWLATQFNRNVPIDEMATEMITATGRIEENPQIVYMLQNSIKFQGYLDAAADVSSHWMGIQINCAKCHDHPFAKWTQQNFYETASFFVTTRVQRRRLSRQDPVKFTLSDGNRRAYFPLPKELRGARITQKFFNEFDSDGRGTRRQQFAKMLTSPKNRQFARAVVNRYWSMLFGRGIVQPTNGFDDNNKPSHPELLEQLAIGLTDNDYDVRWLVRSIMNSKVYQLSSKTGSKEPDPRAFQSSGMRPLTPKQLVDSLTRLTGADDKAQWGRGTDGRLIPPLIASAGVRRQLEQLFAVEINDMTETKISIQQALTMLNSELLHSALMELTMRLMKWYNSPGARIQHIYYAVLSRPATERISSTPSSRPRSPRTADGGCGGRSPWRRPTRTRLF